MTGFYDDLPRIADFSALIDPDGYAPLPDGWLIGVTDVVDSTGAIASGRYKAVNMAGATVIAALTNAFPGTHFPFVFGGDGASFALPAAQGDAARAVLARCIRFVEEGLGLTLRAALIPVADLRSAGKEVAVARHAASRSIAYAMFRGGGLAHAEAAMKRGDYAVAAAAPGEAPDLTGLTCRWNPIPARHGVIASLILLPAAGEDARFRKVIGEVLALASTPGQAARPVAEPEAISVRWPPENAAAEIRMRPGWQRVKALAWVYVQAHVVFAKLIFARNWTVGAFDPLRYRRDMIANADFRKYDDGLKLTLDCTPALADRLEGLLDTAERDGIVRHGLHRQTSAIVTCFVPSTARDDHVHFIDGASGGYAQAARKLKEKRAASG